MKSSGSSPLVPCSPSTKPPSTINPNRKTTEVLLSAGVGLAIWTQGDRAENIPPLLPAVQAPNGWQRDSAEDLAADWEHAAGIEHRNLSEADADAANAAMLEMAAMLEEVAAPSAPEEGVRAPVTPEDAMPDRKRTRMMTVASVPPEDAVPPEERTATWKMAAPPLTPEETKTPERETPEPSGDA
jgi:hypothetical protein